MHCEALPQHQSEFAGRRLEHRSVDSRDAKGGTDETGGLHLAAGRVPVWLRWARIELYEIEIILRSSEFTVHDEASGRSVHPHANVLYTPRSRLTKRQFRQFLKETNERFGAWWKDCGILHSPEEAIKYVSKPADLETLADAEIVWLFNETYRLKFAQPLGSRSAAYYIRQRRPSNTSRSPQSFHQAH